MESPSLEWGINFTPMVILPYRKQMEQRFFGKVTKVAKKGR